MRERRKLDNNIAVKIINSFGEEIMAKTIALLLGIVFILAGLTGFVAPGILGFHLMPVHNVLHLVTGAVSIYLALKGSVSALKTFCILFGAVYFLLGVAGFVLGSPHTHNGHTETMLHVIPGVLSSGRWITSITWSLAGFICWAALRRRATSYFGLNESRNSCT